MIIGILFGTLSFLDVGTVLGFFVGGLLGDGINYA